jgi:ribosome-binding ATPase YchF (GTP1/OBG family)
LQISTYEIAYSAESYIHNKVQSIANELKAEANRAKEIKDELKAMTKAERTLKQSEMMERQVALVNELTAEIPVYSDTVVSYMKSFQSLAISLEAVSCSFCVPIIH